MRTDLRAEGEADWPLEREGDGPLVSVVLPTCNRARWVGRAVSSVLAQSHRPLEVLVIDDGSQDETLQELERFGPRIRVISQTHSGAYAARNLGLRHAAGEFVAFIDSDDVWHSHRITSQLPLMQRADVGLVFGDAARAAPPPTAGARRMPTCFEVTSPRRGRVADHFAWGNFVPTITVLARRSCLEQVGGFPTSHDVSGDYVTWFRIALEHELDYVGGPVADYTVHGGGISADLGGSLLARIELFSAELDGTTDPGVRMVLKRLLFNLGLHLSLAVLRGRAPRAAHVQTTIRRALGVAPSRHAPRWAATFVMRQACARLRRRLHLSRAATGLAG